MNIVLNGENSIDRSINKNIHSKGDAALVAINIQDKFKQPAYLHLISDKSKGK